MKREYLVIEQAGSGLVYIFEVHSEDMEKDIHRIMDETFANPHFQALIGAGCPAVFNSRHLRVGHFSSRKEIDAWIGSYFFNYLYRLCGTIICLPDNMWFLRGVGSLKERKMSFFHVGNETTSTFNEKLFEKIISTNIGYLVNFSNRILCPLDGPASESIIASVGGEEAPNVSRECCVVFQDVSLDKIMDFSRKIYHAPFEKSWFFYFSETRKDLFRIDFDDKGMRVNYVLRAGIKI